MPVLSRFNVQPTVTDSNPTGCGSSWYDNYKIRVSLNDAYKIIEMTA